MARERIVYGEAIRKALVARSKRRRVWLGEKVDHPDDRGDEPAVRYQDEPDQSQSYIVNCSTRFRDAVLDLAQRKGTNVGSLARSVMLLLPDEVFALWPDPGEPGSGDRDTVTLKSEHGKSKTSQRKPRLQVRMPAGLGADAIRRALAVALAMDEGDLSLRLEEGRGPDADQRLAHAEAEIKRLRRLLRATTPDPVDHAVRSRAEALYVMGFPPGAQPEPKTIGARYRALAAIHHPDSGDGDHRRMSQINAAVRILRKS